jgi:hypothetical protein
MRDAAQGNRGSVVATMRGRDGAGFPEVKKRVFHGKTKANRQINVT